MLKMTSILVTIFFFTSVQGQVVNTGGGGPDVDKEVKKDDQLNAKVKKQMIEGATKESDLLMGVIKESWRECYTTKLKAKDLIDLYAQLSIHTAGHPVKLRKKHTKDQSGENCEKPKVFECFLKDPVIQNHLYSLLTNESFHYYLESKGIDKAESRQQLIKYYLELIKGIEN
jgi:hypothetical protein